MLEAKCDHLAGRVLQLERERSQMEAQLRELTLQHSSLDKQHAAVEVKNDHLGGRLKEAMEESEDIKRRAADLERKLSSVESMRNEALEKLEEMGQTVDQAKLSKVHAHSGQCVQTCIACDGEIRTESEEWSLHSLQY